MSFRHYFTGCPRANYSQFLTTQYFSAKIYRIVGSDFPSALNEATLRGQKMALLVRFNVRRRNYRRGVRESSLSLIGVFQSFGFDR